MKLQLLPLLLCVFASAMAAAQDCTIEDLRLSSLPKEVEVAMRFGEKYPALKACKFIGEPVDLGGDGKATDFFVITANACAWGSALGPIWFVRGAGNSHYLVLNGVNRTVEFSGQHT